jgi:hypothetical protein
MRDPISVITAYRTSRGIFLSKSEAEKNREDANDRFGPMGKENVINVRVLKVYNEDLDRNEYFELNPVEVNKKGYDLL